MNYIYFFHFKGVTPAQIVLRFGYERGLSVIPKTSNLKRLPENLDIFGFKLSNDDMVQLESLNRNLRFNDPAKYCEQVFNTFCPIFD